MSIFIIMTLEEIISRQFKPVPHHREFVEPRYAFTGLTAAGTKRVRACGYGDDGGLLRCLMLTEWVTADNIRKAIEETPPEKPELLTYAFVKDLDKPLVNIYMDELIEEAKRRKVDILGIDLDVFVTSYASA